MEQIYFLQSKVAIWTRSHKFKDNLKPAKNPKPLNLRFHCEEAYIFVIISRA